MIVIGSNIKAKDLNFCPKCGSPLKPELMGKYDEGQYYECSKCHGKIEVGLDGRDW